MLKIYMSYLMNVQLLLSTFITHIYHPINIITSILDFNPSKESEFPSFLKCFSLLKKLTVDQRNI